MGAKCNGIVKGMESQLGTAFGQSLRISLFTGLIISVVATLRHRRLVWRRITTKP